MVVEIAKCATDKDLLSHPGDEFIFLQETQRSIREQTIFFSCIKKKHQKEASLKDTHFNL